LKSNRCKCAKSWKHTWIKPRNWGYKH